MEGFEGNQLDYPVVRLQAGATVTLEGDIDPDKSGPRSGFVLVLPPRAGSLIVAGSLSDMPEGLYDGAWVWVRDFDSHYLEGRAFPDDGKVFLKVRYTAPQHSKILEVCSFYKKTSYKLAVRFEVRESEEPSPPEPSPPSERFDLGKWLEFGLRKILRDEEPPGCSPNNTKLLVVLLAMIYAITLANVGFWVKMLGLVAIPSLALIEFWRFFTYMWIHVPTVAAVDGYVIQHAHIAMNLLFLWVFGDNVECRLGHGKYLAYYLICGVVAGLGHVLVANVVGAVNAVGYVVGASGAISGVMAMYMVFFPKNHVIVCGRRMTAWAFLGLWFIGQLAMVSAMGSGVAYACHVFGFLAGLALALAERLVEKEIG